MKLEEGVNKLVEELEQLKIKNRVLEILFEEVLECIVIVDTNGLVRMMNRSYAEFLGIKPEDAVGKHVTEVIENTRLHIVTKTGKEEINEIQRINGHDAVTTRIPIIENNKIQGAIGKVMFKDIWEVEALYKKLNAANKELNLYKERLKKINGEYFALDKIIGESKEIKQLKKVVSQVANTDSTILITGESGTGKEVFANAIHEISDRRDNNFIKINCAAIPENILESELFGYEEGAFTGAKRGGKAGKFELAHGGTILLDEIGDMSLNMQAKILRVLQEKEVMRVGGYKANKIDVRIIAATNQNLQEKIKKGEFREDLYFRLNVVNLNLPALRERPNDVKTLCDYFITIYNKKFGIYVEQIEDDALQHMIKYPWPGNVRELRNVIERAYNFVNGDTIKTQHLPSKIIDQQISPCVGDLNKILDDVERQSIIKALETTNGNKSRAAKMLGINRSGLYQKLKKHGIPINF